MRPLRLAMTAFGPYAGTEVVDFEALADLGLFTVAGRNGSGKTTIFDALHFALYGTLPGRRANYPRLRSDHARPEVECRVGLDFGAHGRHWRVERIPKQRRAKRKGTGDTERGQRATLYEIVDGEPVAIVNRINEVNDRCRDLVGLTGPQFERVALLPQGEFSRLLRESASERRELLRALFSSDVFGDATASLTEQAAEASQHEHVASEHVQQRLTAIRSQIDELVGISPPPATDGGHESTVDRPIDVEIDTLRRSLNEHRDVALAPMSEALDRCRRVATEHATAVQQAIDLSDRLDQRAKVVAELERHEAVADEHDRDRRRLDAARAAVPVVDIANVARNQRRALDDVRLRVASVQHELTPLLAALAAEVPTEPAELDPIVVDLDERSQRLRRQIDATRRERELRDTVAHLEREVDRIRRSRHTAIEQRTTALQRRSDTEAERDRLDTEPEIAAVQATLERAERIVGERLELARLDDEAVQCRVERTALDRSAAELDERIATAERAGEALADHERAVRTASDVIDELRRRLDAHARFTTALEQLERGRRDSELARRRADDCFDAYIRGASARIADTLVDGEPCAVCGAVDHPQPAAPSSDAVDETEVSAARSEAERLASRVDRIEHELEDLRRADPDLADVDPQRLREDIELQTAAAIAAENAANESATLVARADANRARRRELVTRANELAERSSSLDSRRNQLIGALGVDARETVERLQQIRDGAQRQVVAAHQTADRQRVIAAELLELDAQIETIDLACLDLDRQLTALHAELEARTDDLVSAQRELPGDACEPAQIEAELASIGRAATLLTRLRAGFAELASAADASRRAELTLSEKLGPSPFSTVDEALDSHLDPDVVVALEASTAGWSTSVDQLRGELRALGDLPDITPDVDALRETARQAEFELLDLDRRHARLGATIDRLDGELEALNTDHARLCDQQRSTQRLQRVAGLVKGDNAHNTSLENWVLAAHLRDVVELANVRLARSTQHRFQLVVLDEGETRRGRWGLDLAVEDTVTGTRRPTAGLSGGELFQASLALALGLADVVMSQRAGVTIDSLFIDEGFGSLDDASVERVLDLLDDLRSRGATIGVITHVTALLDVLPRGITVVASADGSGSTIQQSARAA